MEFLETLSQELEADFKQLESLLSFSSYLDRFLENPILFSRTSPEYLRDMILHFGQETIVQKDKSKIKHFKVFDAVIGQEEAQEHMLKVLEQFISYGKGNKLIFLHGPNGSSKSTTVDCLKKGLETYSKVPEGTLYSFRWLFPEDNSLEQDELFSEERQNLGSKKTIGFERTGIRKKVESYSELREDEIAFQIHSEFRDNPILLLPKKARLEFYLSAYEKKFKQKPKQIPWIILHGELSPKNNIIYEELNKIYRGQFEKIMRHVQIERIHLSARYKIGIASVEPQMSLDASERVISFEKNIQNIPLALQNCRIFEAMGELVDAHRGLIEFSDLLKRPYESYKYLITVVERMSIHLQSGMSDLDTVFIASSNEKHLDAFKESPDWSSFKARFELISIPYLLSFSLEEEIYKEDLPIITKKKPIAPHALSLLCQWAVLTRLTKPNTENFDHPMTDLVKKIKPYDKLLLYNGDELDDESFSETEKNILEMEVSKLKNDGQKWNLYEGRFGASPRELKMLLSFASQTEDSDSISALHIFEEIRTLLKQNSVYDYLNFPPVHGFHDAASFLTLIEEKYRKLFFEEFLQSLEFYEEASSLTFLKNYLTQAAAFLQNDTKNLKSAILEEFESLYKTNLPARETREFFVRKLASWKIETKTDAVDLGKIFEKELGLIRKNIYEKNKEHIFKIQDAMLLENKEEFDKHPLKEKGMIAFKNMEKIGYTAQNIKKSIVFMRSGQKGFL